MDEYDLKEYNELFRLYPELSKPLPLTEPKPEWGISEGVIVGVITAAVWSVERHPGRWSGMIQALGEGAKKTKEGTVNAFLFRAMVDRLLEEYHALDSSSEH